MVNLSRLIGPAIAGFILHYLGDGMCFLLNAVSFVAVLASLLLMKLPGYKKTAHPKNGLAEFKEGLSYLSQTPSIAFVIIMLGIISLSVLPFSTLLPYFAREVFKGNATTFGIIDSAIGLGALSGAIFLASQKTGANLKKILGINTLVFGAGLILFSFEGIYPLALIFATIAGFGMMSQITISNTLIQTTVDPAMRGRVISFYAMAFFGMQPIGGLLIGLVSKWIGPKETILFEGVAALIIGVMHLRFLRKERLKKAQDLITHDGQHLQPVQ
jgi:MFS family permease